MRAATDQFDEEKADVILPPVKETPGKLAPVEKANRELLQKALAELPVPFRELVLLADVEEMSYQGNRRNAGHSGGDGDVTIIASEGSSAKPGAQET